MNRLHCSWDEARWHMPLKALMLMCRQYCWEHDTNSMTLEDKEAIDKTWPTTQQM